MTEELEELYDKGYRIGLRHGYEKALEDLEDEVKWSAKNLMMVSMKKSGQTR